MNGLYRKIYQMRYFCYTICSKSIMPNALFRYAICAFILYCIARESFMTHRFALLFCNGAHRHRGCSACTAFGVKERKKRYRNVVVQFLYRLYSMLEAEQVSLWAF